MEASLEKVTGVSGEKLEAPEVCNFLRSLDTKRLGESSGIHWFQGRQCVGNGESLCSLEAGWRYTLFIVTGILDSK